MDEEVVLVGPGLEEGLGLSGRGLPHGDELDPEDVPGPRPEGLLGHPVRLVPQRRGKPGAEVVHEAQAPALLPGEAEAFQHLPRLWGEDEKLLPLPGHGEEAVEDLGFKPPFRHGLLEEPLENGLRLPLHQGLPRLPGKPLAAVAPLAPVEGELVDVVGDGGEVQAFLHPHAEEGGPGDGGGLPHGPSAGRHLGGLPLGPLGSLPGELGRGVARELLHEP